jgi:hypothetical protein
MASAAPAPTPTPATTDAPAADPFAEVNANNIEDFFGEGSWGNDTLRNNDGDATGTVQGDAPPAAADKQPDQPASVGAEEGEGGESSGTPPEPPAPPPPPSDEKLELESLRAQVEALTKAAEEKPEEKPTAAVPTEAPAIPDVKFEMPDQLRDVLLSDDPAQFTAGVNHLVSGILSTFQRTVIPLQQEIAALKEARAAAPTTGDNGSATSDIEAQAAIMREQYFTSFGAHRAPEFQPIIAAVAAEMRDQFPGHAWNDQYIAAMGARVTERAKAVAKLMRSSDNPAPPAMLQPGSRSAEPGPGTGDISDEIESTLGFG